MAEQTYATHRRFVPGYHFVLFPISLFAFIGSIVAFYRTLGPQSGRISAAVVCAMAFALMMSTFYARISALRAQDRLIRLEEELRHVALTGKSLDSRLTVRQVVGLRFASDEEFPALAESAAANGTSEADIKKSIKTWRGDYYRV
jgi:hypothetical protein